MQRLASRPVVNLVAAAGPVGDEEVPGIGPRAPRAAGPARPSSSRPRSGRPRSRRRRPCRSSPSSTVSTSSPGTRPSAVSTRRHGGEGLLVAMAVQHGTACGEAGRSSSCSRPAACSRPRNSSNSSACAASVSLSVPGIMARNSSRKREQAGRLEPDDRHAALDIGLQRVRACAAPRARASSTRPAARKVRPQHSGRDSPSAASAQMHAVAGGAEHRRARHGHCRARNSVLKVSTKQDDFGRGCRPAAVAPGRRTAGAPPARAGERLALKPSGVSDPARQPGSGRAG